MMVVTFNSALDSPGVDESVCQLLTQSFNKTLDVRHRLAYVLTLGRLAKASINTTSATPSKMETMVASH